MSISKVGTPSYEKYLRYQRPNELDYEMQGNKTYVWYSEGQDEFRIGTVVSEVEDVVRVLTQKGETIEYTHEKFEDYKANPSKFDGVEDCSTLPYLSEASVLHNLILRYDADVIYTYSGLFLVALNPYKSIPIYNRDVIDYYRSKTREEAPPHVYSLSDCAYNAMLEQKKNQSILITGESGAGKTENTKKVIQYLAFIAGRDSNGSLERQLLVCNPLLEALGNAKTTKNNNSSRFGKFIKITFDNGGYISGASIFSYLLEKSRVVFQAPQERSFHIFYQLCSSNSHREKYKLGSVESFKFLSQSGCTSVDGVDDKVEFKNTLEAMNTMNFDEKEIDTILSVVAAILHLGNVQFSPESNGEASSIKDKSHLCIAADLLGVDPLFLEESLINPRIKAGKDLIKTHLNPDKAANSRDALCMALYGRMFLWIVDRINESLKVNPSHLSIGILDIAGFEIFEYNSLEQLCINYTNECLQQFFNNHMFNLEQEEYKREKIEWKTMNFGIDSQATIDLIENRSRGVLTILDEESVFPGATDNSFMNKLLAANDGKQPKFRKAKVGSSALGFTIIHYAGNVEYNVAQWLEKNKDFLLIDLESCIKDSSNPLIGTFMTRFSLDSSMNDNTLKVVRMSSRKKSGAFNTVSSQYREQLRELLDTLNSTNPHFIRCILPNRQQLPGKTESPIILDQLRCNGVLEGIRIARKGYPNRMFYGDFLKRYYMLGSGFPKKAMNPKDLVSRLIESLITLNIIKDFNEYSMGVSKIFFKTGVLGRIEEAREKKIATFIPIVESMARAYVARKNFVRLLERNNKIGIIQQAIHIWIGNKNWNWLVLFKKSRPHFKYRNIEKELSEKEQEIIRLKKLLEEEICRRSELEASIGALEREVSNLRSSLDDMKGEYEELLMVKNGVELQRAELEKKIGDLRVSMDESESTIEELNARKESMKDKLLQVQRDLELEVQENEKFRMQGERTEKELLNCKMRIEELERECGDYKRRIVTLEEEIDEVSRGKEGESNAKAQLIRLRNKLQDDLQEAMDNLGEVKRERDELQKSMMQLERECREVKQKLEMEVSSRVNSESMVKKLQMDMGGLNEDLNKEAKKGLSFEKLNRQLEDENRRLLDELEREKEANVVLNRKLSNLNDQMEDLKARMYQESEESSYSLKKVELQVEDLNMKLDEAYEVISRLEREKKKLLDDSNGLMSEIDRERDSSFQVEKDKKSLENTIYQLNEELSRERKRIEVLERANSKYESDNKNYLRQIESESNRGKTLEKELKKVKGEYAAFCDEAMEKESRIRSELEKVKKDANYQVNTLEDELGALKGVRTVGDRKMKELESECEDLRGRNEDLLNELSEVSRRAMRMENELEESKIALSESSRTGSMVNNLKIQLEEANGRLSEEQFKVQNLSKLQKRLESDLEEYESRMKILENNLSKSEKARKKAESEMKRLEQQVNENAVRANANELMEEHRGRMNELELKLQEMERVRVQLSGRLKESENAYEELLEVKNRLERQNGSLRNELEVLRDQDEECEMIEAMRGDLSNMKLELNSARVELERVTNLLNGANDENRILKNEVRELKGVIENEMIERGKIEKNQRSCMEEKVRLDSLLVEMEKKKKKMEKEMRDLRMMMESGRTKSEEKVETISKGYEKKVEDLKMNLQRRDKELEGMEDELKKLNRMIQESKKHREELEELNRTMKKEMDELNRNLEEEKEMNGDLQSRLNKKEMEVIGLNERIREEIGRANGYDGVKYELEMRLESMVRLYESECKRSEDLDQQLRKMQGSIESSSRSLQLTRDKLEKMEKKNKLLDKEMGLLRDRLERAEFEKNNQDISASKFAEEAESLRDRLSQEHTMRINLEKEIKVLKSKLAESDSIMENLMDYKNNAERIQNSLRSELKELKDANFTLNSHLITLETEKNQASSALMEMKKTYEKEGVIRDSIEKSKKQLEIQLNDLINELNEEKAARASIERAKVVFEREAAEMSSNYQSSLENISKLEKSNGKLETELKDVHVKVLELQNINAKVIETNNRFEREIKSLASQLSEEQEKISELTNAKNKAENNLSRVKSELTSKKDELNRIVEELNTMRDSYEALQKKAKSIQSLLNI